MTDHITRLEEAPNCQEPLSSASLCNESWRIMDELSRRTQLPPEEPAVLEFSDPYCRQPGDGPGRDSEPGDSESRERRLEEQRRQMEERARQIEEALRKHAAS